MPRRAKLTRRELLRTVGYGPLAAGVGGVLSACRHADVPTQAPKIGPELTNDVDTSGVRLGLDTYTVHHSLTAKDPALRRSLEELLDELASS